MKPIEETLAFIRDKAVAYAAAKSDVEHLREYRKSKKAILMREATKKGVKTGHGAEAYAYSHAEYIQLLDGLKVAVENAEMLRLQIKSAELRIEVWKTQQYRESAEMRLT